jgi:hypothetical protein
MFLAMKTILFTPKALKRGPRLIIKWFLVFKNTIIYAKTAN